MGVGIVFPGQGSQAAGMGRPWRAHPAWDAVVGRAEDVLRRPVGDLLLGAAPERTSDTQLAVVLASLLAWEAVREHGPDVTSFAGHSLGQVTALIAAGVLGFDDGVRFVLARAEATQAAADHHRGGMVALLGATDAQVDAACSAAPHACFLANDNAPGQVVIAGTLDGLREGIEAAKAAGVPKVMVLRVRGAFHTRLMEPARGTLRPLLRGLAMSTPSAPVVANGDARPYDDAAWSDRLADHLVQPVRWRQSLEAMAQLGVDSLVEVGRGPLAAMARRTIPGVPVRTVGAPDEAAAPMEAGR